MHLTFKIKKNGRKCLTFYIRPRSAVDSAQWDWVISQSLILSSSEFIWSLLLLLLEFTLKACRILASVESSA